MPESSLRSVAGVTPVAHRSDVLARLSADSSVLKAMGLSRCSMFGSFARDQAIRPDSDVDLLVSFRLAAKTLTPTWNSWITWKCFWPGGLIW